MAAILDLHNNAISKTNFVCSIMSCTPINAIKDNKIIHLAPHYQNLCPFLPRDSYANRGICRCRVSVCVCLSVCVCVCHTPVLYQNG